jgi:hypothetical protein
MTSNGRQLPMEDDLQWKRTSNGRQPSMEDDLKILTSWDELISPRLRQLA